MKANATISDRTGQPRKRRFHRLAAGAVVGVLALSACTSDPGPRRVAQDIIEAESLANPSVDEECLLEQLNEFSDDDLNQIQDLLNASNADDQNEGRELLAEFEAALGVCS